MPSGGKQTVYPVNGSGGAYVNIPCTIPCRHMTIVECAPDGGTFNNTNFAPQGLNYKLSDDGYTKIFPQLPASPIELGNRISEGNAFGPVIGWNQQTDHFGQTRAADVPIKLISATATSTQVLVTEYP